jgi:hypothetical protein
MANATNILRNARTHLPGATEDVLEMELFNVIDEFCRDAGAWGETIELELLEGTSVYPVDWTYGDPLQLYEVAHDTFGTTDAVYDPETRMISFAGIPTAEDVEYPVFLSATMIPVLTDGMELWLPPRLWTQYHQAILSGLLARMMGQPNKPYSNPALAVYHARRFRNFIGQARAFTTSNGEPGGQNWSFPRWAV